MAPSQDVLIHVGEVQGGVLCRPATADLDISYY
jgi:hypothetical protein